MNTSSGETQHAGAATRSLIETKLLGPDTGRVAPLPILQPPLSAAEQYAAVYPAVVQRQVENRYSQLMPATPPRPGQQYAFEVDLDRCTGCKSCVAACHALNGLDEQETWRDVGLLVGGSAELPVLQHVTMACHHCLQPACSIACPVNAYEKDPVTGIVVHLDDQCFGCRYCTLACPYDVPKYHRGKGIVRKCDMCRTRLERSEAPACVQACPHQAITITSVEVSEVVETHETHDFLPGAPDPKWTLPTTVYRTSRVFPRNLRPADYYQVRPSDAHWPLVITLVLTQMAVGTLWVGRWLEDAGRWSGGQTMRAWHAACAVAIGLAALGASTLHLGRPWLCFRAVLGLRHSWLSREILAFLSFAVLAVAYGTVSWLAPRSLSPYALVWCGWLGWVCVAVGAAGVACSAMVYAATKRPYWNESATLMRFFLSTFVLGVATSWLLAELGFLFGRLAVPADALACRELLSRLLVVAVAAKLLFELSVLRHLRSVHSTPLRRTAQLHVGQLAHVMLARLAMGLVGGVLLPQLIRLTPLLDELGALRWLAIAVMVVSLVGGEILERYLFFSAAVAPRMPGAIQT